MGHLGRLGQFATVLAIVIWATPATAQLGQFDSPLTVQFNPHASFYYYLECASGGLGCSRPEVESQLDQILGGREAVVRVTAKWKETISRYAVVARLNAPPAAEWPDVGPRSGSVVDLRWRIQKLLFSGDSIHDLRSRLEVIMAPSDVDALAAVTEVAWPMFHKWWSTHEEEWTAYHAQLTAMLQSTAAPTIRAARAMYGHSELEPLLVHLVPLPLEGPIRRGSQMDSQSFLEFRPDTDPASRVAVVVHEYCHYLFARSPVEIHSQRLEALKASTSPGAEIGFSILNETLATALGNGLFMKSTLDEKTFAEYAARPDSFYSNTSIDLAAKAILPLVEYQARSGGSFDREFFKQYFEQIGALFATEAANPQLVLGISQVYYTQDAMENAIVDAGNSNEFTSVYHNRWAAETYPDTMGGKFNFIPTALVATEADYLPPLQHLSPGSMLPIVNGARANACRAKRKSGGSLFVFLMNSVEGAFEIPNHVPACDHKAAR